MPDPAVSSERLRWTADQALRRGRRDLAEETPVALVHDGSTTAVMMASPADLEDFGLGFSLSEGVVDCADDVRDLEVASSELGVEVRMWLVPSRSRVLSARRRRLAGPTGCGLCGVESLAEAVRPPRRTSSGSGFAVAPDQLLAAMQAMEAAQDVGRLTRAVHAAALWRPKLPLLVREDVGRHNALDKLVGAAARGSQKASGVLLLTSRVSVEMVQKATALDAPVICAVSAPTALAVRTADAAGLTLVAVTRADGFEIFSHPDRIEVGADAARVGVSVADQGGQALPEHRDQRQAGAQPGERGHEGVQIAV